MQRISLTLALVVIAAATARAQEPVRLTMDKAIELAVQNNRDLKTSRLDIDYADAQVTEAFGNALPTLDLNASYRRNLERPVFFFPGPDGTVEPIKIGSDNDVTAGLNFNQVLFNSAVFTGVGTAKTYAQISRQQLRTKTSEVVLAVKQSFYSVLFLKEVMELNQQSLKNAEENYKNTKALYDAGLRSEFDAIRAEVQVANLRPAAVQAEDNYKAALDNLRLVLGMNQDQPLEVDGKLEQPSGNPAADRQAVRGVMERYNPTLKTLDLSAQVNDELIKINQSEYLPTLSLFGAYQYQAQADNFSDFDFQPTLYAGLNLSLNLFTGFQTQARVEQARVDLARSRVQRDQTSDALITRLEGVRRRIDYALERINVGGETIRQAERGYKIAVTAYQAGTGTQLQINDADLALAQAKLNRLNAIYDYHVAVAELEQLLGENYSLTGDGDNVEYLNR